MTDHDQARELAAASFDFGLSAEDRAELSDHLAACASCRTFNEGLEADARALAGLPAADAPDALRSRIVDGEPAPVDAPAADPGSTAPRRPAPLVPVRYRRPAALVASAAVVVALIGGLLLWGSRPGDGGVAAVSPSPDSPIASGWRSLGPDASPGAPSASGVPGEPGSVEANGDWHAVAALVPDGSDSAAIDLDGTFRLTSLDGTPPAELGARIRVDPPVALTVAPEPDGNGVRLTPSEPLVPGTVYRFTLAGPTGETVDSWAFQTTAPLQVVSTLPEGHETGVPVNTGIEITFDQDGVTDAASHVTIEPKTSGRFEQHGRVLAFVPDALKPGTIYTVTVARGVTAGPGAKPMADDLRFQFETDKPRASGQASTPQFSDVLYESGTSGRPVISMWTNDDEDTAPPVTSAQLDIYRFGSLDAAIAAYRQLRGSPAWAQWANEHPIETGPLTKVASLDAHLTTRPEGGPAWTELPEPLPAGWYLIEHPATPYPGQAILQVTDIATYLVVTDTKTLLWTNDLATGGPLQGATVAVGGAGSDLGTTDGDGVLTVATPAALQPPAEETCGVDCVKVVSVTKGGRSAFVPASDPSPDGKAGYDGASGHRWLTFATDRSLYRRTDTVNLWGMIRDRTTGKVPSSVAVRLQPMDEDFVATGAPIATLRLAPRSTGTFSGSVALTDVPEGWYELELVDGSEVVRTAAFQVDRILKPAYRIEVETGHRAYVVGERIKATIHATFFEGSPVPGVPLRVSQSGGDRSATTDKSGTAIIRTTARLDEPTDRSDREVQTVSVSPRRAEEGQIQGASRELLVFPGSRTITAESRIATGRVRVAGTINALDRAGLERDLASGMAAWEVDPRGAPVARVTVTATFFEQIPVKKRTGTDYDFIEKRTVPVYEYTTRQRAAGTVRVRTDARGRFTASVPAGSHHHDYSVIVKVADADGHVTEQPTYASDVAAPAYDQSREPALVATGIEPPEGYSVGAPVDLTLRDPAHPVDKTSRYLFHLTQLGLHDVVVQRSPRYVGTFESWAVPNVLVTAVRFTGRAFTTATYSAAFRTQDRSIDVRLTTDKARYSPRDQVTVAVRTTDAAGKPIAASVVLRTIDEKLFAIGRAEVDDPLGDVYSSVDPGIISSYVSHHGLPAGYGEGGDTTGGGGDDFRDEFRDSLLFKTVETGADGRATASFRLSDDLTSWRILGSAFSTDVKTGTGSADVAVGLPFFVDASIAPEYLLSDRPTILARAYGSALPSGARVTISATAPSLGLKTRPTTAAAFADVPIRLPALTLGTHTVTITATYGTGPSARTDRLVRTFTVVRSRLATTRTAYVDLAGTIHPAGGAGLTRVVVADSSAGRHLPLLTELAAGDGVRLERALAAAAARDLLTSRFGESAADVPAGDFTGARYQQEDGGISLVPAGGSDLQVSVLVALTDPEPFSEAMLRQYFVAVQADPKATRERQNYALAGLAGLHTTVLAQIQAAAAGEGLTVRERLVLGLGAAALGDAGTARSIARSLISHDGEQQAGWARLRVGKTTAEGVEGTALMAILAAATGDPLAPAFWAYVEANPVPDLVVDLHAIGYVERLLERLPPRAARFAYTVDGTRTVVDLKPGGTFSMVLTAPQLASLAIERLTGSIGVTTDWREPVKASTIERDADITVTRTVRPGGTIRSGDFVIVSLRVRFGQQAPTACHLVTELVPSGLIAVGPLDGVFYSDSIDIPEGATPPFEQTGQRLSFCAENAARDHIADLRYEARVITPGTYTWEPAVVESRTSANHAALTAPDTVTIR